MTQHSLTPKNPDLVSSVIVGWDRPMHSFFGDVLAKEPDSDGEDNYLVMVGTYEQITDPRVILDKIGNYAEIPADLLPILFAERLMSPNTTMEQHNQFTAW